MLDILLPKIPEHHTYVEPFAGGLAVLLNKPASRLEIVNDLNEDLITFYRYVRFHEQALYDELEKYHCSRSEFEELKQMKPQTDLQRAVRWYLLKVNSFGAQSGNFQLSRTRFSGFEPARHIELIKGVAKRLQKVTIECRNWETIVAYYDSPETFIFLDPPYVECTTTSYEPFSVAEMTKVRERLEVCQGKWLLTCDNSPSCQQIFKGFTSVDCDINYTVGKGKKAASEMIVMSPNLAEELEVRSA